VRISAGTHDHTKSGFSVVASADHAGQRRHRLEHGRYQGRFNFREPGCHSTQPAPTPSIEAFDKALLLLFAARGCREITNTELEFVRSDVFTFKPSDFFVRLAEIWATRRFHALPQTATVAPADARPALV